MTIRCADSRTEQLAGHFVAWLAQRWPASRPVSLYVAPDEYGSIGTEDCCGFGVYLCEGNDARIGVISPAVWSDILTGNGEPADEAHREFLLTIAHEYAHHLQLEKASSLSDDGAQEFAENAVDEYLRSYLYGTAPYGRNANSRGFDEEIENSHA